MELDQLSGTTLWRLQAYVEQHASKVRQPAGAGAGRAGGVSGGVSGAQPGGRSFAEKTPQQQVPASVSQPVSANGNNTPAESAGQPSGQCA